MTPAALRSIGLPELFVAGIVLGAFIIPAVLYLISLQRALDRCAPESRTVSPGKVWLLLIPGFNLIWQFLLVDHLARSLHNEFVKRSLAVSDPAPGKTLGTTVAILSVLSLIPFAYIGYVTGAVGFVCWILYWIKIAGYSRTLEASALAARA